MRSRKVVAAAVMVALIGAGVAYAAASPSAKLQKQDRLYGGGQFGPGCFSNSTLCFGEPRNFAVDAHAEGDGNEAVGNSTYGAPGGGNSERTVTCLRVEGSRAAVGGVIVSGSNPGWWYVEYFVDRGGPATGDRDLASPSFIDSPGASGFPAGFPAVCPSPSGTSELPAIYQEVHAGDVVVQDAPAD